MILADTKEILIEFDYNDDVLSGRISIPDAKLNRVSQDIQRIATDLSLKGTSILFTINKDEKFDKLTPAKMMKN